MDSTTTTAAKNAAISARLLALRASGLSMREAFDSMFGPGAHAQLVSGLYDALRAQK